MNFRSEAESFFPLQSAAFPFYILLHKHFITFIITWGEEVATLHGQILLIGQVIFPRFFYFFSFLKL